MIIFSNAYVFPALQVALFIVLIWAFRKDNKPPSGSMVVTRAKDTMAWFERVAGIAIIIIVSLVNKAVFDVSKEIAAYPAAISAFDYFAIAYLYFYSRWGRNKIVGLKPKETENH
jgi:hypothetical protein